MHRFSAQRLATVGALALIVLASAAACGSDLVSPLPVQTAGQPSASTASQTSSATPAASTPPANAPPTKGQNPGPKPTRTKTTRPPTSAPPTSCFGAIRHDLDLQNTELALIKSMCFKAGGVLRLQGIGPGLVTVEPASLVAQNYEGGVVDIRFLRPGTVTVTIPQDEQVYTITVVVIR